MKIRLLSDLHLEFSGRRWEHLWEKSDQDKETILILAGDIDIGAYSQPFMTELSEHFKYVLRICGNHEFYEHRFDKVIEEWKIYEESGPKNFHFLHNDVRWIDGVRFIGGTMWTSFDDGDPLIMAYAHRKMSDYQVIYDENYRRITPAFILKQHDEFMDFYLKEIEKPFDGPTVVITHHSPGNGLKLNGRDTYSDHLYHASIEEQIAYHGNVKLWLHGHTHRSLDYMINDIRVVCNPFGYYPDELNPNFDKNLILEL